MVGRSVRSAAVKFPNEQRKNSHERAGPIDGPATMHHQRPENLNNTSGRSCTLEGRSFGGDELQLRQRRQQQKQQVRGGGTQQPDNYGVTVSWADAPYSYSAGRVSARVHPSPAGCPASNPPEDAAPAELCPLCPDTWPRKRGLRPSRRWWRRGGFC